jgi:hypothetical protein
LSSAVNDVHDLTFTSSQIVIRMFSFFATHAKYLTHFQ